MMHDIKEVMLPRRYVIGAVVMYYITYVLIICGMSSFPGRSLRYLSAITISYGLYCVQTH